ncbi:hypothetical protein PVAND_003612 [Polypedilum vanderplanki]|uniref:HSF-type DNA-binding domain-containing protein n=1 Tax=Polypedilum vanderplanki TaxID=319348 RepID=A0A9J6BUK2_POLVA|nr:hypothetical protein PVAND_003612 [Polypedilum vanderplanki]
MHPIESGNLGVPAFLAKLWRLVEDSDTNELISWSQDGKSFFIQNQAKFAKELLPLNYKHNNMASFIRQLNMYGFHKITSIDNGGLKFDKDEMEFSHPYFQKGHPYLLEHIKRKIAHPKQPEADKTTVTKVETMNRVLHEVKNMRGRQDSLDTRFSAMKQENEALWREVAILRQKHMKQQQIVNKLIQFLVTIVQPNRGGLGSGIGKRRYQLMINDAPQAKVKKTNNGPIISELTEELLDDVESDLDNDSCNFTNVQSPESDTCKNEDKETTSFDKCLERCLEIDDNVDEIDTNNMKEYCKTIFKKKQNINDKATSSKMDKQQIKKEATENASIVQKSTGKSLLIPSKDNKTTTDITYNIINADNEMTITNNSAGITNTKPKEDGLTETQYQNFDDTSQNTDLLDDEDLFKFVDKKEQQQTSGDDSLLITKYNRSNSTDIMGLNSLEDYSNHIDTVQSDLDSLKDLLHNDAYQLDTNQLLGNGAVYTMPFGNYDADTISKMAEADATLLKIQDDLFGNDDLIGYEMSPANMELFAEDKKDDQTSPGSEVQQCIKRIT